MLRIHPGFATQKPADSSVPEEKYSPFQYLRTKMILWILVFLLPILILLCVSMHRILDSYSNQMTANHSQSLRQYTADIDAELAAAKRILYSENVSLDVLRREPGSDLETLENMKFWGDILVDDLKTQENLDAFFLYDNGKTLFIQNYNTSYAENRKMADTLTKYLVENQDQLFESSGNYQAIKTEDDYYLYLGYEADGGIFGCWFSVERLLKNICDSDLQGMVEMLTCHCRYVLYSSQFVLLDEELNFIRNYIQLQEILHSRQYHLSIECPEELLDYEIPVLMIQILVENTIKHAGGEQIPLEIRICVSKEKKAENSCMKIAVSDNGRGFPEEVLQKLRDTDSIHQPGEGHGIGIDNIRRRLHLIYGDTAIIIFKNEPEGGTMVEMEIPVSHL